MIKRSPLTNPVISDERAIILDVLRGFAILGIFLDNVFSFSGYGFFNMQQREALPTFYQDAFLSIFELAFVHGKFYSIFSLLFGIGFSISLMRNKEKASKPLSIFYRRLFILLIIGASHLYFLWEGDILLLYALVGFVLPLFKNCSNKTILIWAVALIASPIFIDCFKVFFNVHTGSFLQDVAFKIDKKTGLPTDGNFASFLFKEGSGWREWRIWQASSWAYRYAYIIESNRIPKVLGMFLFGFYVGRKMMYAHLEEQITLLKKLKKWGFIIGIPTSIAMAFFEIDGNGIPTVVGLADTLLYAVSVVPLCFAYVATICLFWIKTAGKNKLKYLSPVGRMALTNYLLQTLLGIGIFYGVGFGLGGKIGPTIFFPIVIAIYFLQIIFSNCWFKHFNYGPVEWIWRQLTYLKRLPIKKTF